MSKSNGNLTTILGRRIDFSNQKNQGVIKVMYETNLSKFSKLDDNRDIDKKHVAMLAISIKKYGQLMPIVVNEALEVIEGQHRLEACMELGIPVAYIISIKASSKDVAIMNNSQKGWKNKDFLKHFSHKKHSNCGEYKKIVKFFNTYSLPFSIGIILLADYNSLESGKDRGPMPSFRDGSFKVINLEDANTKAGQLIKFKTTVPNLVKINKFCIAFLRVSQVENFSIRTAYERISKNSKKFDHCNNQDDWVEAMVAAYNYNLVTKGKKANKKISLYKVKMKKEG
jgi:hypothetical protein|tara:strand:+ start:538 stop:1389 length:852 start_codon:yes stop_codon:yes gene_type:complete